MTSAINKKTSYNGDLSLWWVVRQRFKTNFFRKQIIFENDALIETKDLGYGYDK